jgi:hypothetical protein
VIVIRFDFAAMQRAGRQFQRVSFFDNHCAAFLQFRAQGLHTLAFLNAQASEIHECLRRSGKG